MDTYHWDALVTYHWDVVGCFIWDLLETSWRRTDETSSLRPLETWSRHTNKMSWRRTTETSLGVSFETYLRRCWDVQRDVVTTSPRRLIAGWDTRYLWSEREDSWLWFNKRYLIQKVRSVFWRKLWVFFIDCKITQISTSAKLEVIWRHFYKSMPNF